MKISHQGNAEADMLESVYFQMEAALVGGFVVIFAAIHLWRSLRGEMRAKICVVCNRSLAAEEHVHHLELCATKLRARLERTKD